MRAKLTRLGERLREVQPVTWVAVLALACVVIGWQCASGAFGAELGGHPDEASHFISGLMVRDYVAAGLPRAPMEYAVDYYLHYPKVALGHWPPLFYVLQAAWMLAFPATRVAVLLLMAVVTTALAVRIYLCARDDCGEVIAAAMGLLFVCLPKVQRLTSVVMSDMLLALLCFTAALAYGRFLEKPGWRPAAGFGLWAVLALMTHPRGVALALLPGLAVLIGRRLDLLRRAVFWFPVVPVVVFCGPWYATWGKSQGVGLRNTAFVPGSQGESVEALTQLAGYFGWGLGALVVVGLVAKVVRPLWRGGVPGRWAALAALALSVLAFNAVVKVGLEARYLLSAVPALLVLAGAGVKSVAEVLAARGLRRAWAVPGVLLAAGSLFAAEKFQLVRKPSHGYPALVRELLARPEFRNSVMLVSAHASSEGAFIAEVALEEQRPGHFVLRASKALASSTWKGTSYQTLYAGPEEVAAYLESVPVGIVALDTRPGLARPPHYGQLREALSRHPERWERLGLQGEKASGLALYNRVGHQAKPPGVIRLDMRRKIGRIPENR